MKKIVAIVAAVCMIFSLGAFTAFAADSTATVALALNGEAPTKVGDEFVVDVVVKDLTSATLNTSMVAVSYDQSVVAPANTNVYSSIIERDDSFYKGTGIYSSTDVKFGDGMFTYTLYIDPNQTEVVGAKDTGIPYTGDFTIVSLKFVVVAEGDAKIEVVADPETKIIPVPGEKSVLSYESADITIGGGTPSTNKVITAIEAPADQTVELNAEVTLPATVKATADGAEVELAVTWDPATIDTTTAGEKTATGTVTVPEGYELGEGVSNTVTAKVTVKEESTEPTADVIEGIVAPTAAVTVGAEVTLPKTVTAIIKGSDETVELAVVWDGAPDTSAVGETTVTGTVTVPEGYELGEGVTTTVVLTVKVAEAPAKDLPMVVEASYNPNGANGHSLKISAKLNEAYTGSVTVEDEELTVVVTYLNGKTPIGVRSRATTLGSNGEITEVLTDGAIPENTTNIEVSVVKGVDFDKVLSETNLGIPVANGYNFVVE